eukprot:gene34353-42370_t
MATAIYYKNNHDYDDFKAIDWIPENQEKYGTGSTWGKPSNTDYSSKNPKSFLSAECVLNNEDDSTWTLTRIGPIKSTGGYDWLQIGWDDLFGFEAALSANKNGIYVVEQLISPTWTNGSLINHPPIHIHHMHTGPAPYVRQRFDQTKCLVEGKGCFNPDRTMEHHGELTLLLDDYNCVDADGYTQAPLRMEGELIDVRSKGSEEIE